ncbi:MAG: glycosyltransferase family 9 protein [Candidatus Omnitrophica bacterium]|nr:glycosyltransferase family 9 protein [Candidatus Omnitrophota bacterium]
MYKKILVINLGGIGDILLSQPAIRALKNKFFDAELNLLVVRRVAEFLKNTAYSFIDKVFIFEPNFFGIINNLFTLFYLREKKFDLAINMRTLVSEKGARNINMLFKILSAKKTAGRDTEGRGNFFDIKIPETDKGLYYERDYDIMTVEALGISVEDKNIYFHIEEKDSLYVEKILKDFKVDSNKPIIGFHIGGMPSRRWPIEYFAKALDIISRKFNCVFVVTGSKDEVTLAKRLKKLTDVNFIDLIGKLTAGQLASLIKKFRIFVSNDTGPMHLAAVLKVPLVAIFGPGDLTRYNPKVIWEKAIVLEGGYICSPCNKVFCRSKECLYRISYEKLVDSVLKILNKC